MEVHGDNAHGTYTCVYTCIWCVHTYVLYVPYPLFPVLKGPGTRLSSVQPRKTANCDGKPGNCVGDHSPLYVAHRCHFGGRGATLCWRQSSHKAVQGKKMRCAFSIATCMSSGYRLSKRYWSCGPSRLGSVGEYGTTALQPSVIILLYVLSSCF